MLKDKIKKIKEIHLFNLFGGKNEGCHYYNARRKKLRCGSSDICVAELLQEYWI